MDGLKEKLTKAFKNFKVIDGPATEFDPTTVLISISLCNSFDEIQIDSDLKCHSLVRVILDCNKVGDTFGKDLRNWSKNQKNIAKNIFTIYMNIEVIYKL